MIRYRRNFLLTKNKNILASECDFARSASQLYVTRTIDLTKVRWRGRMINQAGNQSIVSNQSAKLKQVISSELLAAIIGWLSARTVVTQSRFSIQDDFNKYTEYISVRTYIQIYFL